MNDTLSSNPSLIITELSYLLISRNPDRERIQYLLNLLLESGHFFVRPQLIRELGIYFLQHLFRDQEDNDAVTSCLLMFQAYGYSVPPLLVETFVKWKALRPSNRSPFPQTLAWSTSALMQIDSAASLDSPVVHVWVYNDKKNLPIEIIICGRGIGWIRDQVDNLVLSTALCLSAKSADVLLEDIICLRLTADEIAQSAEAKERQTTSGIEAILTGGKAQTGGSLREEISPVEAMKELVAELTQLEAKTGLVVVTKRPHVLRSEYQQSVTAKSREYLHEGITLWQHTATDAERVIYPYPVLPLNIHLPFSLVESRDFRALHDLYCNDIIRAAIVDALRRLNFYTTGLTELINALKIYNNLATRPSLPESVSLEIHIDWETALTYRVKDPTEVTRDEYYGQRVPILIGTEITWIRKIKKLINTLSTAIAQPDSNLNRLVMARLIDAALRDMTITANPEVVMAFEAWKKKIQPLLWYLWEKTLKKDRIKPDLLASRQLFFMMDMDIEEKTITARPFILADTKTTLFVFDSRYPFPILHSLYDRLTETDSKPQPEKAHQALVNWKGQIMYGKKAEAQESLKSALAADPNIVLRDIIDVYQRPFMKASIFENQATKTKEKVFPLLAHNLGFRFWSHNAVQSGYSILDKALTQIQNEPRDSPLHDLADIPLTLAWLKALSCFSKKELPEHLKRIRHGSSLDEAEKEIQHYLYLASKMDDDHLKQCLKKKDLLITTTLRELRSFSYLSSSELSMFNILRALAFVQAAQGIARGIEDLEIGGESPRSIYAKIGPAADEIWSNQYILDVSDQLDGLINLLLGYEVV